MKYLRTFENTEDFKVGDTVYCIDNKSDFDKAILTIGKAYKITLIFQASKDDIRIKLNTHKDYSFYKHRFTKDPYHPILIQLTANKYNL